MQILCKHKDFYDYKCYEFSRDTFPTFDRRKCNKLDQSQLTEWVIDLNYRKGFFNYYNNIKQKYNIIHGSRDFTFCLEAGTDKYIFAAFDFSQKEKVPNSQLFEYDCSVKLIKTIKNTKKILPAVMTLFRIKLKYSRKYKNQSDNTPSGDEYEYQGDASYFGNKNESDIIELPVLSETKLAGLLDPHEIYISLDSYLRSLHNEVNQESEGLTDEEKAVNKGFDKRESFRNIHPRN